MGDYPWIEPSSELKTIPLTSFVPSSVAEHFEIRPRFFQPFQWQHTHMCTPDLHAANSYTYSAMFKSDIENDPGNIALVYTYPPTPRSSRGIFFGCSTQDIDAVHKMRSNMAGGANYHPLLLPAIFAELQTSHLHELGETLMDKALTVNTEIEALRSNQKHFQPPDLTKMVSDINTNAKLFEEDIATAHRHLKSLISCIKPRDPSSTMPRDHYDKFRGRFEQMSGEYDDLSGSCRVNIGKAILNAETHATVISKHAAQASVVLAFVAMIYLPISAVASVFAMPILDFKADWKDMNGRPIPTEAHSSGNTQPVVVSYYMAHYLGVSLALLLLTLEGWYISTRENGFEWKQFWKFLLTIQLVWKVLNGFWKALGYSWGALKVLVGRAATSWRKVFRGNPSAPLLP